MRCCAPGRPTTSDITLRTRSPRYGWCGPPAECRSWPARAARRGRVVPDEVIAAMAEAGLAGLEVDHRDHLPTEREALRSLAADLGVFVTGSSDYHGAGKVNRIGENLTAPTVLEALEAAVTATPVLHPTPR